MPLLSVERLTIRFGGLRAVGDLSFSVEKGEILGLIGPNGAGKTTVFNAITGFVRPTSGRILLEGRSIGGLRPHAAVRRGVARTFQIVRPFKGLTVKDNVVLAALLHHPQRRDAEAKAGEALERAGLSRRAGDRAGELPLGDQKRLEVARALATDPRVLLLDEPMGGLNPSEVDGAVELVRKIRDTGVTVLLVEHVMKAIMKISDRVVVINQGEKIAEGAPAAVVADPAVLAAYFGKRAS